LDIYDQPKEPVQVVVVEEPDSIFKESLSSIRKALLSVNEEYHVFFLFFSFLFLSSNMELNESMESSIESEGNSN